MAAFELYDGAVRIKILQMFLAIEFFININVLLWPELDELHNAEVEQFRGDSLKAFWFSNAKKSAARGKY